MAAPKVYNNQTGEWQLIPEHAVTDGVASGQYSFEQGLQVPAVAPDGSLVNIPAEHVQSAFKNGFRWQTNDDQAANEAQQKEQINANIYDQGNAANAFIGGVVQGGIPGANYLMRGAGAMLGHGDDVAEGLRQTEKYHPGMMLAGNIVGAVASPITAALSGEARAFGGLADAMLPEAAATLAGGIIPKTAGSAMEGAYFGLHDALNESALGDPSDVAETLMTGAAKGLIFGAGAGAGFRALGMVNDKVRPILQGALSKLDAASQWAARQGAKGVIYPAVADPAERAAIGSLVDNKQLRDLVYQQGEGAVDKLSGELESTTAAMKDQQGALLGEMRDSLKGMPKVVQGRINEAMNAAGGDFYTATNSLFDEFNGHQTALDAQLKANMTPSVGGFRTFDKATENIIKTLERSGDGKAEMAAGDLSTYMKAQKSAIARDFEGPHNANIFDAVSQGRELQIAHELRQRASGFLENLGSREGSMDAARLGKQVQGYVDHLTEVMHNNPEFGEAFQKLDSNYAAMDSLRSFISDKTQSLSPTLIEKLKADPELAHEFDAVMSRFPQTAPLIQNLNHGLDSARYDQVNLNAIRQSIRDAGAKTYGRLTDDDIQQLASHIGDADLAGKSDKLKELQAAFAQNGDVGPITKLTNNLRALGRPVPDVFAKMEPHQKDLETLMRVIGDNGDQSTIAGLLASQGKGGVTAMLMRAAKTAVGGFVGGKLLPGPLGTLAGAAVGSAIKKMGNPVTTLDSLWRLENHITQSYKTMYDMSDKAVKALTSPRVGTVTNAVGAYTSLDDRRATFNDRAAYLGHLSNPDNLAADAAQKIGTIEGAPNITAAVHGQYAKAVQFLQSKVPPDPLAHQGLSATNTRWTPPDMDLSKFERYTNAVENPAVIMKNIASGRVSPEEIETLQNVYPNHYQRLQGSVLDAIMGPKVNLSYQQRTAIGQIFGLPVDLSMRPNFIQAMQKGFAEKPGPGPKPGGMGNNPKVAFDAANTQSQADQSTFSRTS